MKVFTSPAQRFGQKGEDIAVSLLDKAGFSIVERNAHNMFGEIDVVAKKDAIIYFFEIKTGHTQSAVHPIENLHQHKLRKLFKAIGYYKMSKNIGYSRVCAMIILFSTNTEYTVEIFDL